MRVPIFLNKVGNLHICMYILAGWFVRGINLTFGPWQGSSGPHHWAVHWLLAETSKPVHSFDREYIGHHSNTHFIILKIFASYVMKLILYTCIYIFCLLLLLLLLF